MRHLLRLGVIALLAVLVGAGAAMPAAAGGPTSVFVAYPRTERTASAYHSDELYERLAAAVGINTSAGIDQQVPAERGPGHDGFGSEVRVTWLIHDMRVWRVDRIFFAGDDVWIQTRETMTGDDEAAVWHKAKDPAKVRAVLADTGVLRDNPRANGSQARPSEQPASKPAEQAAASSGVGGPPAAGLIGLGSAVLGIGLGIGGTLLVLRTRGRQNPERIVLTG